MLRNVDRPELLIFTSALVANDRGAPRLIGEALEAGTPVVFLKGYPGVEGGGFDAAADVLGPSSVSVVDMTAEGVPRPPHPGMLSALRHSLSVMPDGFGGSGGFGTQRADPPRPPLAARCVCFDDTVTGCYAARAAGMRAVGVHPAFDDVAGLEAACDVVFASIGDLDAGEAEVIYFDDLYTPGSFWLNPALPRDADGNRCDPDTGPTTTIPAAFQQGNAAVGEW